MPLPDEIRDLADQILARLDETRDFYLHTEQAWRLVHQIAHEGRPVGIVEATTGLAVPASDLESLSQRYLTLHVAGSAFRSVTRLLEEWIFGIARLWLRAYPRQLDAAYDEVTGRTRAQRRDEIQVPLSQILVAPDIATILEDVAERVLRDLAYRRPDQWFRFLDNRVNLGCPDESQRQALCEMKAARDVLEHNRGIVGQDYLDKAGSAARYTVGNIVQIEEPYLLNCFTVLKEVIEAMAAAAIRKSSGSPSA